MTPKKRLRTGGELWTEEQVSVPILMAEQGITGPQGLDALGDPEWADDEQDRAFLAVVLGDDSESDAA